MREKKRSKKFPETPFLRMRAAIWGGMQKLSTDDLKHIAQNGFPENAMREIALDLLVLRMKYAEFQTFLNHVQQF